MNLNEEFKAAIAQRVIKRTKDGYVLATEGGVGKQPSWVFDFRSITLQPQWLDYYAEVFWERFANRYPFQVCGIETAGIALAAAIVMKSVQRGTPVNGLYVRKSRKRKDLMRRVEGTPNTDPVLIVDDIINTGQTFQKHLVELKDMGLNVTDLFGLVSFRTLEAYDFAKSFGAKISALYTLEDFGIPLIGTKSAETPRPILHEIWHYNAPEPSMNIVIQKSQPLLYRDKIYVGSDNGTFRALDKRTGDVLWEYVTGLHPTSKGILSSPALHAGIVYFGAYDGNIYALDAATGAIQWVNKDADWIGSSPAIAPQLGLLFIGLEFGLIRKRGGIAALDLKTGAARWTVRTPALTHGTPLYIPEKNMVVVGSFEGVVYAYNAKNGELLWRYPSGGDIKLSAIYDKTHDQVVFASTDAKCYALDSDSGKPNFAQLTGGDMFSTPLLYEGMLYVSSLDKRIYALDAGDGSVKSYFETAGRIFSSPTAIEGSIWVGSNDGRLYELTPEKLELKGFHQFPERVINKVVYDDETKWFFVSTVANQIFCMDRINSYE